jgi:hypothetical protein
VVRIVVIVVVVVVVAVDVGATIDRTSSQHNQQYRYTTTAAKNATNDDIYPPIRNFIDRRLHLLDMMVHQGNSCMCKTRILIIDYLCRFDL